MKNTFCRRSFVDLLGAIQPDRLLVYDAMANLAGNSKTMRGMNPK